MSNASALILLPPRQTAQDAHPSKSKKPASKVAFAPKLAQASKASAAKVLPKAVAAKPAAASPVPTPAKPATSKLPADADLTDPAEKDSGKVGVPPPSDGSQEPQAADQTNVKTASDAVPLPNSGKGAAVAQSALASEKKVVKPRGTKVAVDSTKSQNNTGNAAVNAAAKPVDTSADATDADGDSDSNPAIGGGFYGSTKVVARGGAGTSDERAAAAAGAESADGDGNASEAAGSAAASVDPQASPEAEIAGAVSSAKPVVSSGEPADTATVLNALTVQGTAPSALSGKAAVATTATTATPSQTEFVQQNHPTIVSSIQGQLLPNGGSMSIRLNPQELGAVQVTVHMKDGAMTASFETSNENATKVLSRSLGQLKSGLEAAGMSVEKLQVEQSPAKNFQQNTDGESKQPPQEQQQQAQQDQQRRELMQRMLRKIAGGGDPLDLVA